ncbi:MAG: TlpA family protein disulfide reductase [Saprospiraceae bacterium]|nr:TlpA family protein disulfide reductase [Saprospiraceae bacterium]
MNNTIASLVAILLLKGATQCSTQSVAPITGKIILAEGWKPVVYLIEPRNFMEIASNYSGLVVDSAVIGSDGKFAFTKVAQREEQALFQLCIQKNANRFPNQLLDDNPLVSNYMPIVLQKGERLNITTEARRFQATFSIQKPSAENLALLQLRDIRHKAYQQEQQWLNAENTVDENALLEHEDAVLRFRTPLMTFADSSAYFWSALVATRWVSPESDYERVPEFMFRQCEKWRAKMDENQWNVQLCQAANREKLPVLTGDVIPDFPLPMLTGDTIQLQTLLGSRLTILDIWASWCAPCRRENREVLSPLWAEQKDRGLQILGYSIDSSLPAWKAAIAKDQATWPHASHLIGDATPFLETLRITTIPANFILDAHGKVLAKNLHGEALKTFVEGYLK